MIDGSNIAFPIIEKIKQRDSGEETLVTLTPVGGRQNVPTIVGPQFSKGKDILEFIKFDANLLIELWH